jgi:hypothetical protein
MIRLILGITLCTACVSADPDAPLAGLAILAIVGLYLAATGARQLSRGTE